MAELLGVAVFAFILTKLLFSFLAWYLHDEGDKAIKEKLADVWVKLDDLVVKDGVFHIVEKLLKQLRRYLSSPYKIWLYIFLIGFVLNGLSAFSGYFLWSFNEYPDKSFVDILNLSVSYYSSSFDKVMYVTYLTLFVSVIGASVDMLSLLVTWKLLNHAIKRRVMSVFYVHIVADLFLMSVSVLWAYCVLLIAAAYINGYSVLDFFITMDGTEFRNLFDTFFDYSIVMGASSVLPTLLYVSLIAIILLMHWMPQWLRGFLRKVLYLLQAKKEPVLSQLGNFLGGVAAILAAGIKLA